MRGRRHKLQVSTFPFLAVLLCAMGSLILVLLVMDRKAHRAAQARAQREAIRLVEERAQGEAAQQAERERLQQEARTAWEQKRAALHDKLTREQIEMQVQMRQVREQLQEIAARLHYEQDTSTELRRKVQSERDRLQAEEQLLRTLRSRSEQTAHQSKESSQALRRMTLDLLQMEQALKDLQASRQREQKTFSVVPYHGRRGENRRPIYVECTADAVIFHPEHKAISLTSLLPGAPDPSAAIRAEVAQRVARQRAKLSALPANADTTPYLLLLVRPTGVNTYNYLYHCALKDLQVNDKEVQVDFGYEFIDDDWVLDFPADDEQPSTQPWMSATKSPVAAADPPRTAVSSSSQRTPDHPVALAPMGDLSGNPGGIRGFRASETGGVGNWVRGAQTSGAPAGTGSSLPPGSRIIGSSSSVPGLPGAGSGGGGMGGAGGPGNNLVGGSGGASVQSSGTTSPFAPSASFSQSGGEGSDSLPSPPTGGRGVGGEGGIGFGVRANRGSGRGHPAALAPSFREGGDGGDFSGDGAPPPNGLYGPGVFSLRPSGTAQGYGSSMQGSPGVGGPGAPGGVGSGSPGSGGSGSPGVIGLGSPGVGGSGSPVVGGPGSPGAVGSGPPGVVGLGSPGNGGPGSPGGGGSELPGLGPPRALSSSSRDGYTGGGTGQSGSAGTGSATNGAPGNGMAGGNSPGSGTPSSAAGIGTSVGGQYLVAQGNNGGSGYGQGSNLGGGGTGTGNSSMPGALGNGGSSLGTSINNGSGSPMQGSGGSYSGAPINNGSNPSMQGSTGSSPGVQPSMGGNPGTQAPGGPSMPANGGRSSDVVVYVDPLTGKPTSAPRPTTPPPGNPPEEALPETDGQPRPPRVRVVAAGSGGGGGGGSDPQAEAMNRFAPTPSLGASRHKPVTTHPAWVHGGRDWTIYVECRADCLVLYPSQRAFPLAQVTSDPSGNPLNKAIQQMIDRRQALRRPGEPPYRPQVCLLVRPEYTRTFLTAYPALEALPVPTTRRNLDADDDVIDIINGASP